MAVEFFAEFCRLAEERLDIKGRYQIDMKNSNLVVSKYYREFIDCHDEKCAIYYIMNFKKLKKMAEYNLYAKIVLQSIKNDDSDYWFGKD